MDYDKYGFYLPPEEIRIDPLFREMDNFHRTMSMSTHVVSEGEYKWNDFAEGITLLIARDLRRLSQELTAVGEAKYAAIKELLDEAGPMVPAPCGKNEYDVGKIESLEIKVLAAVRVKPSLNYKQRKHPDKFPLERSDWSAYPMLYGTKNEVYKPPKPISEDGLYQRAVAFRRAIQLLADERKAGGNRFVEDLVAYSFEDNARVIDSLPIAGKRKYLAIAELLDEVGPARKAGCERPTDLVKVAVLEKQILECRKNERPRAVSADERGEEFGR